MLIKCFIWTQTPILTPSVFWPKFGLDKDWVCQLLIQFVQDKSPGSQEETYYALCWQQGPVVLFPLRARDQKGNEGKTQEPSGTSSLPWDPLGLLPPPSNPQNGTAPPPPATAATAVTAGGAWEGEGHRAHHLGTGALSLLLTELKQPGRGTEHHTDASALQPLAHRVRMGGLGCRHKPAALAFGIKAHHLSKSKGHGRDIPDLGKS